MTLAEQIQRLKQYWQELVPGSVQLDKELKHTQVTHFGQLDTPDISLVPTTFLTQITDLA